MYCRFCGKELLDQAIICPGCGAPTDNYEKSKSSSNIVFYTLIKIFMIIGCVANAFYFLIPLAWCIPMTLHYIQLKKDNQPVGTGFKICVLLFVNLIAGILMLCDKDN